MQKTKIEWTDYVSNPIKGKCRGGCPYCYARRFYDRFGWDPTPRLDNTELNRIENLSLKNRYKIFLCSTHDMFGDWVPDIWRATIFDAVRIASPHIFQVLTKFPENISPVLPLYNCWLGTTVDSSDSLYNIDLLLDQVLPFELTPVPFVSFEPLLEATGVSCLAGIKWVIIGAQTNPYKCPKKEWIDEIVSIAKCYSIPVFMKNNLKCVVPSREFMQEMPAGGEVRGGEQ